MDEHVATGVRRLEAARLLGAGALAVLAQFAVDAPGGPFGAADRTTTLGLTFVAALILLMAAGLAGILGRRRWDRVPIFAVMALGIGAFLPTLTTDPIVGGAVVVWFLILVGRFTFPTRTLLAAGPAERGGAAAEPEDLWLVRNHSAVNHLASMGVALTVASVGYGIGARRPAQLVCLAVAAIVVAWAGPFVLRLLARRQRGALLASALLLGAALSAAMPTLSLLLLGGFQLTVVALIVVRLTLFQDLVEGFYENPALLVLASFVVLIALGTLLLSLPAASAAAPIAPLDALFTATSASCVTGLIVLDTPTAFSFPGQLIILLLIQAGGLNIMVLSAFAALLLGHRLGLRGQRALGEMLELERGRSPWRLVRFIVLSTLVVEGAGAAAMTAAHWRHGLPWSEAVWPGVFHAISAFCNAGFALQTDSLVMFQRDPLALLVMAALITVGGLGFGMLALGWTSLRGGLPERLGLQLRAVLVVSAVLVVVGTVAYAAAEWEVTLAGLAPIEKWVNAFFQSVTLRTAGFNSVALEGVRPASILLMLVLMLIGASPGGTGGGIKTTTALVLLSSIPAAAGGRPQVVLGRRALPVDTIFRSAAIAVIYLLLVLAAAVFLLASQPLAFDEGVFEAVSATGTVGLSLGGTARVDGLGKGALILVMLAGRIGPLSLALLLGRRSAGRVGYPEARIMVG